MEKGFINIDITKLVKADWNYKEENENLTDKLINNIKRNGQIENIIIRELDTGFYEVVNGNHRYDALKKLKYKKVYAYNFGQISLSHAQRIAIETNETKFESDNIKLAELIKEITNEFSKEDLALTLPYNEEEIQNYSELLDFDWEELNNSDSLDFSEPDKFNMTINLKVTPETYAEWEKLKERLKRITGYDNESKVFEFAIIEALNTPIE